MHSRPDLQIQTPVPPASAISARAAAVWPPLVMEQRMSVADGCVLYRRGDPLRDVTVIVADTVLLVGAGDFESGLVAIRDENWLLNAAPALRGLPVQVATAIAWGCCELSRIPVATFLDLSRRDAAVAGFVIDLLALEAIDSLDGLVAIGRADLRSRLLHVLTLLFRWSSTHASVESRRFRCAMTRTLLAKLVSAERESVVRQLSVLEREGWIARENGWLIVPEGSPLHARLHMNTRFARP